MAKMPASPDFASCGRHLEHFPEKPAGFSIGKCAEKIRQANTGAAARTIRADDASIYPMIRRGQATLRRMIEALVPPNPKELDRTTLTSRLRAMIGTRSIGVSRSGFSRLMVGGTIWSRMARIEKIASIAPAAPRRWPVADLVDDIDTVAAALPSRRSTASSSRSSPSGVEVPWALTYWISSGRTPPFFIAARIER